jgi:hypothetical protein
MRIAAVSDLHGHLPAVPACDLLLLPGDLCPVRGGHDVHHPRQQALWLAGPFRNWLSVVPAAEVVATPGNHDFIFQQAPELVPAGLRWTCLIDQPAEKFGLRIWGTPWQPWFYDWAYNADPDKMKEVAAAIPADTDLLVMHGPPRGFGDRVTRRGGDGPLYEHVGCPHLLARTAELAGLKLAVYGHIHSGHGVYKVIRPGGSHDTLLANVSLVDEAYRPVHGVTVFDYDPATGDLRAEVPVP